MAKRKKNKRNRNIIISVFFISGIFVIFFLVKTQIKKSSPNQFKALPTSFYSYGIDISHYQGNIDWDKLIKADSSISFVYCKATEGLNLVDRHWKRNRESLIDMNLPHGAYHFFRPKSSAKEQALHFLNNYQSNQSDLPPVLDAETFEVSNQDLIKAMKVWLEIVEEKTGKRPVIYTSYHMYSTFLKAAFKNHKFWVANYSYIPSRFNDEQIIHWQFTDQGTVNGIKGNVDVNFSKIQFKQPNN